jgi:glycosyltransferase involved in cell wall biosynthesis
MTRVLVLTRYDHVGASSRVRFLQYIPHLERMGLKIKVHPLFSNESLVRLYKDGKRSGAGLLGGLAQRIAAILRASKADVVWLQQEVFPFLPAAFEAMLLAGRPYVIDFDDAYQLYYQDHPKSVVRSLYGGKVARLMRGARTVVVGNDTLAAYARASGARDVHLVYSAVDTQRIAATAPPRDFTVGWIGTPMTAEQSLHVLREPLKQFLAETKARCMLMGADERQYPDIPAVRQPWSEAAEETFLAGLSVGLCPLDDSAWTRGKSGYKIIQYMSAGRPALTSPVGIAADLVEPETTGFHCRTAGDWYSALTALYGDSSRCAAMGATARAFAEARYDTRIAAAALHKILTGAS